jgi:uncharacterized membrane protein YgdD (TMEM256/DUF423 family)
MDFYLEVEMNFKTVGTLLLMGILVFSGCAQRIPVLYDKVEQTNYVEVTLLSGKKIEGTVLKLQPHQLTLQQKKYGPRAISKSSIRSIRRKSPVYDDFGNGISEEEIRSVQTTKNTLIYGIGGGMLSLGASFFIGSLAAQDSTNSATVLTATTAAGGGLGTYLFVRAGKAKDRKDAIETIREKRRSVELKEDEEIRKTPDGLSDLIEKEKKKQEELRIQREKILRELGEEK